MSKFPACLSWALGLSSNLTMRRPSYTVYLSNPMKGLFYCIFVDCKAADRSLAAPKNSRIYLIMRIKDDRDLMLYDLTSVLSFPKLNGIPK